MAHVGAKEIYLKAKTNGVVMKEGAGKGLEPLPWCECHNRNPCPARLVDDTGKEPDWYGDSSPVTTPKTTPKGGTKK